MYTWDWNTHDYILVKVKPAVVIIYVIFPISIYCGKRNFSWLFTFLFVSMSQLKFMTKSQDKAKSYTCMLAAAESWWLIGVTAFWALQTVILLKAVSKNTWPHVGAIIVHEKSREKQKATLFCSKQLDSLILSQSAEVFMTAKRSTANTLTSNCSTPYVLKCWELLEPIPDIT